MRLWLHAGEHHWQRGGKLEGYTVDDLEGEAQWRGEPGVFVQTLTDLELLDRIENGFEIPHMEEHNRHFETFVKCSRAGKSAMRKRWAKNDDETENSSNSKNDIGSHNGVINPLINEVTNPLNNGVNKGVNNHTPIQTDIHTDIEEPPNPPKPDGDKQIQNAGSNPKPEDTPRAVSIEFVTHRQQGKRESAITVEEEINALLAFGITMSEILGEVRAPPSKRLPSERFFHIRERLKAKKNGHQSAGRPLGPTRIESPDSLRRKAERVKAEAIHASRARSQEPAFPADSPQSGQDSTGHPP
jgi:hypothetical protein